ncbi:MAG: hypothetical protein U0M92_03520 [Bacilli bacterium]
MNDFDEIISNASGQTQSKSFDKSAWIKKKQEDRKQAYDLIDKTALEIVSNVDKFKTYLDVQGRFDKYSVGNALLISAQMPNAIQLKEFDDWKDLGAYIKKNATSITILEPGDSYTRADGSTATSYNAKKMFDVSQTTFKQNNRTINYDDKIKLTALLKDCPVDIKAVDEIAGTNSVAQWNKQDNVLYVKRGGETGDIFKELASELARVGLEETGNASLDNFKCRCTSYMLCKKYGIDVSSFNLDSMPDVLKNMNSNEIRNELSSMRNAVEDINSRMNQYFESISKTTKNKEHER